MNRLLVLGAVAVLALVALFGLDSAAPVPAPDSPAFAATADDGPGLGSTWYCAASGAGTASPVAHAVTVANPTDHEVQLQVSAAAGPGELPSTDLAVGPRSSVTVDNADLGADPGGVTVSAVGTGVVVTHRLVGENAFDEVPCVTTPSSAWYFAAADTRKGSTAQLWVYNPFATDTSFDVTVFSNEAVRQPTAFTGVVVGAHRAKMVDLGQTVERRAQFAFSVVAREGSIVAELAQTSDGSEQPDGSTSRRGLRIGQGSPSVRRHLEFADGLVGSGAHERYVVFNPTDTDTSTSLRVLAYGSDASTIPEPIVVDVKARRFAVVDLDSESRVVPDVPHRIIVDVSGGPGVVVTRVAEMSGGGGGDNGPGVSTGIASSSGSPMAATRWIVGEVQPAGAGRTMIAIANTSTTGIALVSITAASGGSSTPLIAEGSLEIPAGGSALVDAASLTAASVLTVESNQPVVVEIRTARGARRDFSVSVAVPVEGTISALDEFAGPTLDEAPLDTTDPVTPTSGP